MITREKIIELISEKFFREGFSRTTMDEIATDLHMSKKTIYKFFSSKEELLNMSNFDLFIPKDSEFIRKEHRKRPMDEGTISGIMEMNIERKDGTIIPIETQGMQTLYQGQLAIIAYIRDITERKKIEQN